ncbi:type IV pilus modification protein PilV [Colwellia sp. 12G3]|uniref:type IV pilus modification protein PilV n=1 Tax=Colwellia sp. 12G3 TaxID=2058299 RepID=UPI000C335E7F|nr:type IV pilus modification protein PilV [Colwellia sp. 12G3]PKI14285.1 type IV pilus modification protein PilV [Colwellia sp. 12G3]
MCNLNNKLFSFNTQQGMTFIEVIVAFVIIVTGILGAVAMQATAKQGSFDAMQRSLASSLAQDIVARMRAHAPSLNPNLALITYARTDYGAGLDAVPTNRCSGVTTCTAAEMAANDIFEWERALMGADTTAGATNVGGLVGGRGCITQNGNAYTVVVSWQGRTETVDAGTGDDACGINGRKRRQVVVQAFIF